MNANASFGRRLRLVAALAAFGLALAACGGDGNDNGGNTGGNAGGLISGNTVSPTAGASSDNFIAAVKQLAASSADEASEPLTVQDVAAPAEDTAEPVAVL